VVALWLLLLALVGEVGSRVLELSLLMERMITVVRCWPRIYPGRQTLGTPLRALLSTNLEVLMAMLLMILVVGVARRGCFR
jgi:hypothetical protein